jgi:hypothetical protein
MPKSLFSICGHFSPGLVGFLSESELGMLQMVEDSLQGTYFGPCVNSDVPKIRKGIVMYFPILLSNG